MDLHRHPNFLLFLELELELEFIAIKTTHFNTYFVIHYIIDIYRQYYSFYISVTFVYTAKGKQVTQYMSIFKALLPTNGQDDESRGT